MSPIPSRPDANPRTPRRRRIALLLVAFGLLAAAWSSPVLLMSPDAEGRALIAAGVPRADFPALVAEGGNAYAADTIAHDWADTCDRESDTDAADENWLQHGLSTVQRLNPFAHHIDCDRIRAIALRTESLHGDADDDTCADDGDDDDGTDAPTGVAAVHRQGAPTLHRRHARVRRV